MKRWMIGTLAVGIMTVAGTVSAGDGIFLSLKANGADVPGEQKGTAIECVAFEQGVDVARDLATGLTTGRRTYQPLKCTKRIDRTSPLIQRALTTNQVIEATFRFYRPSPKGTEEQYYTIAIKAARVSSIKTINKEAPAQGTFEEVAFTFQTISWTFTNGGITHEDSAGATR